MKRIEFADIEQVWRSYQELGSVHKVAAQYGCSHSTIQHALKRAGYRLNAEKWTAEEDAQVTAFYRETPPEKFDIAILASTLHRSVHGIHMRAFRLGLTVSRSERSKSLRAGQAGGKRLQAHQKVHGHARGMAGKKHSNDALDRISQAGLKAWAMRSEEEKEARNLKIMRTRAERGILPPQRLKSSWKAGWHIIGGRKIYFRSSWEVNYANYLQWLKSLGKILEWEFEAETFWFDGIKRGCVSYLPDFRVTETDGEYVYYEIKGWMDERSRTKIKRMAKYHPAVKLIVVDSKEYNALSKKMKNIVPGWI